MDKGYGAAAGCRRTGADLCDVCVAQARDEFKGKMKRGLRDKWSAIPVERVKDV